MTRRLALAWSLGASLGLLVGFLVGESVRDGLDLARLRRPEPREGAGTGTSATAGGNGAQIGAQPLIPAQGDDEPCPQYSPGGGLPCSVTGEHTAHIFLGSAAPDRKDDADERIE